MIEAFALDNLLIWSTVIGPLTIVLMMYMRVINLDQSTLYRKILYLSSLFGMFGTSMLLSLSAIKAHVKMWDVPEIVGLDLVVPLIEIAAVFVIAIFSAILLDSVARRLATDVVNPLWVPKRNGGIKEKTTRLVFQLTLVWFVIGSFINLANYLSGNALLGTQSWMHSFSWTVFLPALVLWLFATAVRNTRKELLKREDSASTP